jgi:5,10-methylenetetrahydrofolate reductase
MPTLAAHLVARDQFVRLYGTTPPRSSATEEIIAGAAAKLAARVAALPVDGFVVYDLQDESGRSGVPRPFPFVPTVDARGYAKRLRTLTGKDAIAYKCIGALTESEWQRWLIETLEEAGLDLVSLVGRPTSRGTHPMSLKRAYELAAALRPRLTLGGVAIAERHEGEAARLMSKAALGCDFFVSQAVYHPAATIRMLGDYAGLCREAGVAPRRVVMTFVPCGRDKTMAFMKWLGIAVPAETEAAILTAPMPLTRSIAMCRDNLSRILEAVADEDLLLGVNTESVSIHRDEIDASIDLFHALGEVVALSGR